MSAVLASRVVAEFYRGVDFPDDWTNKPAFITTGMARERILSAIVLLDAKTQPLAACWQVANRGERFVRIRFDDSTEDDLLDQLNDDLREQSSKVGASDLFATLLWEPEALSPTQGLEIHPARHSPFGSVEERGWNVATREIVAQASDLLLISRQITTGLASPVPANAEEMHQQVIDGGSDTFVVLPTAQR